MGRDIAEGYRRNGSVVETTGAVKSVFRDGNLLTMYGNL